MCEWINIRTEGEVNIHVPVSVCLAHGPGVCVWSGGGSFVSGQGWGSSIWVPSVDGFGVGLGGGQKGHSGRVQQAYSTPSLIQTEPFSSFPHSPVMFLGDIFMYVDVYIHICIYVKISILLSLICVVV